MGDRFILTITCPVCGFVESDVYYAPTCGFRMWICPQCGMVIDLAKHTGISEEDASNKAEIEQLIEAMSEQAT